MNTGLPDTTDDDTTDDSIHVDTIHDDSTIHDNTTDDDTIHDDRMDDDTNRTDSFESLRNLVRRPDGGMVTGLSADLADALGIDALWIRLGFVLFALVAGIGIVAYLGLWLVLVVGARHRWARPLGAVVMLVALPLIVSAGGGNRLLDGQLAVIVLLIGLTFALWRPPSRSDDPNSESQRLTAPLAATPRRPAPADRISTDQNVPDPVLRGEEVQRTPQPSKWEERRRRRATRPRTPPSPLGRSALGVAVVVAAGGGLVDQLNGGRMHPEQWLGAAAVVCGLGLLVGAMRGHARWLIVPAGLFAVTGYGSGLLAQAGVPFYESGDGGFVYVSSDGVQENQNVRQAFGDTAMEFNSAPQQQMVVDSRTAVGNVFVSTADDIAVEFRTDIDDGDARVDGVERKSSSFRVGPNRSADVIVDLRIVRGDLSVTSYNRDQREQEMEAEAIPNPGEFGTDGSAFGQTTAVAVGALSMTVDGVVVIDDGVGLIGADNQVLAGEFTTPSENEQELLGVDGSWRLVGNLLISPYDDVIDLDQARREMGVAVGEIPPIVTVADPDGPPLPTIGSVPGGVAVPASTTIPGATTLTMPPEEG